MNMQKLLKIVQETDRIFFDDALRSDVRQKGDADFVTQADISISTYLHKRLATEFPHIGFVSEEEAWPPPKVVVDAITKKGSLYYKGVISSCSYEECKDLEVVAVWDRHHVVDRLMGIDIWEKSIRRPMDPNEQ